MVRSPQFGLYKYYTNVYILYNSHFAGKLSVSQRRANCVLLFLVDGQTVEDLVGPQARIGDLCHRVLVPAVNLTKGLPQVFKTSHNEAFTSDLRLKVVDVALAATAAPTYFPVAEVGDELFADGGLYANSPDALALHEAEFFLGREQQDIALLSVGTTTSQFSFSHATGRNLGILSWAREQRLVSVIMT
jgi:uncharacterized protein